MMFYVARVRRAGFTLIEIMIVIAIIAILAGIVVPNFMQARAESQLVACRQNIMTIVNAGNLLLVRHSNVELRKKYDYPCANGLSRALVDYGYLDHILTCPASNLEYGDMLGGGAAVTNEIVVRCSKAHSVGNSSIKPAYRQYGGQAGWADTVTEL